MEYSIEPPFGYEDDVKVLPMEEYKVRIENQTPSTESFEAGQELTFVQAAQWVEMHGSTKGLQRLDGDGKWWNEYDKLIHADGVYRVAPKKVNDPDDPTTWESGVAIFVRDSEYDAWLLDTFNNYSDHALYKYITEHSAYKYAKLATPEQIEAWKLINGDL